MPQLDEKALLAAAKAVREELRVRFPGETLA